VAGTAGVVSESSVSPARLLIILIRLAISLSEHSFEGGISSVARESKQADCSAKKARLTSASVREHVYIISIRGKIVESRHKMKIRMLVFFRKRWSKRKDFGTGVSRPLWLSLTSASSLAIEILGLSFDNRIRLGFEAIL
jgi:hypothetical protein